MNITLKRLISFVLTIAIMLSVMPAATAEAAGNNVITIDANTCSGSSHCASTA